MVAGKDWNHQVTESSDQLYENHYFDNFLWFCKLKCDILELEIELVNGLEDFR